MSWRRKSEIDDELHEAIMEATARAIAEHGIADLTVRDIGAEFDRSRSLIHYHYNSKDDLLAAFVEYIVDRYTETGVDADGEVGRLPEFVDLGQVEVTPADERVVHRRDEKHP